MSPVATVLQSLKKALEERLSEAESTIPVVTLLSGTDRKELFVLPATRILLRAALEEQLHEPLTMFRLSLSMTLSVRLDDDISGALFAAAHESLWNATLDLCADDGCEALGGDEFAADGCQFAGAEEPTLDTSDGVGARTVGFSLTVTGHVLNNN